MNVRFTAWFSERERKAIEARAGELNTSANYIVRSAVRQYLGLDNGRQSSQLSQVTTGEANRV